MKKLAVITTHPIQYNAPLFQLLSKRGVISLKVFYTWGQSKDAVYDERFGVQRSWDVPLLDGYAYEFIRNTSFMPDSNRFFGIINPELKKKLKQEQFDVVLIYRWSVWSHLLLMISNLGSAKLWFRGDSHLHTSSSNSLTNGVRKWLMGLVYKKTTCVFYAGALNKNYFSYYKVPDSKLVFMPHAVDNSRFIIDEPFYRKKADDERKALGVPADAVVFLYAGKFYDIKNLTLLIRAFKQVKGSGYFLVLYGSGTQQTELQQLAAGDERIFFRPFQNQSAMPWVYRVGDVYVLPSKSETWGLGANEAMACGLPAIVSSNCGCAPELIIENKTGFSFQTNDEADLLNRLQRFTDKELCQKLGALAQQHTQEFSIERQAQIMESCLLNEQ